MKTGHLDGQGLAELRNYKIQMLASAPTSSEAKFYYNTSDHTLYVYNGTSWIDALSQGLIYTEGTGIDISGNTISVDTSVIAQLSDIPTTVAELSDSNNYAKIADLATVATSGDYNDLIGTPTVDQTYSRKSTNAQSGVAVASAISSAIASVYKPAGSSAFANLPPLFANIEGYVFNITDAFTTTSDFVEGAGKEYPAGTNIVCISTRDGYKWDILSGFIDLSGYQTTISDLETIRSGAAKGATSIQSYNATNPTLTSTGGVATWVVTHNLNNSNVAIHLYEVSSGEEVIFDRSITNDNSVTIKILASNDVTAGAYKVVVNG